MVLNTYKYLPDDDGHDEVVAGQGVAQLHAAVDIESVAGPEPALHPESQVKGWVNLSLLLGADTGWPRRNGKKLSCSQACCLAQLSCAWLLLSFFPYPVCHPMSAGCTGFNGWCKFATERLRESRLWVD